MPDEVDRDEQTLTLRDEGRSFAGIAEMLGLESAHAANAAFNRALRCRSRSQQEWLRSREMRRLDAVASRVRERDDLSVEEIVRRLRGVKQQRKTLFHHMSL
jgi:DNA-binding transcriptional MerR regulator